MQLSNKQKGLFAACLLLLAISLITPLMLNIGNKNKDGAIKLQTVLPTSRLTGGCVAPTFGNQRASNGAMVSCIDAKNYQKHARKFNQNEGYVKVDLTLSKIETQESCAGYLVDGEQPCWGKSFGYIKSVKILEYLDKRPKSEATLTPKAYAILKQ